MRSCDRYKLLLGMEQAYSKYSHPRGNTGCAAGALMQSYCRTAVNMCLRRACACSSSQWQAPRLALGLSPNTSNQYMHHELFSGSITTLHNTRHLSTQQGGSCSFLNRYQCLNDVSIHAQLIFSCQVRLGFATREATTTPIPLDASSAEILRLTQDGQRVEVCKDGWWVWDVKVSPNGKLFATGSDVLQVWDSSTGTQQTRCDAPAQTKDTYSSSWQVYSVAWSPDGSMIAACPTDHVCRVWDVATGAILHELQGQGVCPAAVAWSPDGRMLATGSYDNTARVYNVSTGAILHELKAHERTVWCVQWSPDGCTLATGSWDSSAALWDTETGAVVHRLKPSAGELSSSAGALPKGHAAAVKCMAWSADGRMLATGSDDHTAIIWDVATGDLMHELEGHHNAIVSIAWSPDGDTLATASFDGTARLWQVATGTLAYMLKGHDGAIVAAVAAVAFNPHGSMLASASFDGSVKLWEVSTGELLRELTGHRPVGESRSGGSKVHAVSWTPCGRYIYSASVDGTVRICKL